MVNGSVGGVDRDHVVTTTPLPVLGGPDLGTQTPARTVTRVPGTPVTEGRPFAETDYQDGCRAVVSAHNDFSGLWLGRVVDHASAIQKGVIVITRQGFPTCRQRRFLLPD